MSIRRANSRGHPSSAALLVAEGVPLEIGWADVRLTGQLRRAVARLAHLAARGPAGPQPQRVEQLPPRVVEVPGVPLPPRLGRRERLAKLEKGASRPDRPGGADPTATRKALDVHGTTAQTVSQSVTTTSRTKVRITITFTNGATASANTRADRTHHGQEGIDSMLKSGVPTDIVESILLGIVTDPLKHEVVIRFRMREHEFSVRALGVDHMLVNEFLHQNIVDEARIWNRESESTKVRDLLAALLFDCEQSAEVTEPGWLAKLEDCAKAVGEGRKVLLELVPVYGATVLLLAASLEWSDEDKS
jgi:hypothetical protein